MKIIIGYITAGLGLLGILLSSEDIKATIAPLESIPSSYLLILGIALVIIGVVIMIVTGKSTKQKKEVPIYNKKGKDIVGYRRMK